MTTPMKTIPEGFEPYRRTPRFTADTLPESFKDRHATKPDVWGRIVVERGAVKYRVLEPQEKVQTLRAGATAIIEPQVAHDVEFVEDGEFYVEFFARAKK